MRAGVREGEGERRVWEGGGERRGREKGMGGRRREKGEREGYGKEEEREGGEYSQCGSNCTRIKYVILLPGCPNPPSTASVFPRKGPLRVQPLIIELALKRAPLPSGLFSPSYSPQTPPTASPTRDEDSSLADAHTSHHMTQLYTPVTSYDLALHTCDIT